MTRTEIIELVHQNTERKWEKLNIRAAMSIVLQDFCARNRFWWRKGSFSFNTMQGTPTYDLTLITTTPALTELAIEEIIVLQMFQSATPQLVTMEPVLDDEQIGFMVEGFNANGTAGQVTPERYTFDPNDYKVIRIDAPNGVYKLRAQCWLMPNPQSDSVNDAIPLVPPWHHKTIVAGMEAYIWKRVYGPGDDKYITAKQEYEDDILNAQARPSFTTNRANHMVSSEQAIRSTI